MIYTCSIILLQIGTELVCNVDAQPGGIRDVIRWNMTVARVPAVVVYEDKTVREEL